MLLGIAFQTGKPLHKNKSIFKDGKCDLFENSSDMAVCHFEVIRGIFMSCEMLPVYLLFLVLCFLLPASLLSFL